MRFNIQDLRGDLNKMDQRRLDSYFRWFRMKVTTTVSFLAWTGMIISVLAIIAGILTAFFLHGEVDSNAKILQYFPVFSYISRLPFINSFPYPTSRERYRE